MRSPTPDTDGFRAQPPVVAVITKNVTDNTFLIEVLNPEHIGIEQIMK